MTTKYNVVSVWVSGSEKKHEVKNDNKIRTLVNKMY